MSTVKYSSIGVGDFRRPAQQLQRHGAAPGRHPLAILEQLHCFPRPHRPLPQQTADDAAFDQAPGDFETKRRQQIQHNVVIIARVEGDVLTPCVSHGSDNLQRVVAIEGGDLDRHDIFDFREPRPKRVGQAPPAHRLL